MAESVSKICRICLKQLDENVQFYPFKDNSSMLLLKFLDFFPEIDLEFVRNPISCNHCKIIIDRVHEFKKLCMQTESVIKDLKMQGNSFDDVISYVKKDTEIKIFKQEIFELKDEPLIVDDDCLQVNTDLPVCVQVPSKLLFYCYSCNYTTYDKKILAQHMNIDCLPVRQFKCNQGTYTTPQKKHIHKHPGAKLYNCAVCNYCCNEKMQLKLHKLTHTRKKPNKCNVCDYSCKHVGNLKTHILTHIGEKLLKCDVCDYRCNQQSHLIKHIRTHTGEKPYKCNVCDYSCNNMSNLRRHILTHTGEKPHKCDVCDYRCNKKDSLKRHIRTHTGEKPYKCDVCDYRFNKKDSLKRHIRTHTREKPYKCDVCDYSCAHRNSLKVHLRSHAGKL